ncbi:DUF5067 domain-containing protein [Facklamia miroungae]|uniref:DUF5067 domain-containing protein n=1 Tax=Facklamia miroungae TaxID=120956 RepID=A0A1G7TCL5_9LACT|nr:DUF5067 domain-containing protein [Facklamia miroungae]NKZ29768.1 DUF5067 domain-containing protein [Facklamia miroungae]SDG33046.1 protein of unknown function [Facklamia miroungae]
MSTKRILLSTIAVMSIATSTFPINTIAQEATESEQVKTETTTKGLSYTYEEAAKKVDEDFYDQYLYSLHYYGVTDEMIATLPEGSVREAAIQYLIQLPTGGDISMPYAHFKKLYPSLFSNDQTTVIQSSSETSENGLSFTYEEAAKRVDQGFYDEYLYSLHYYGVTDKMLAKLPKGSVREAAIQYLIKLPTGGDITMPYAHFKKLYPELFNSTSSNETDSMGDESIISPNHEKLTQHLEQQVEQENVEKETLPFNYTFTTDSGKYTVKYVSLLEPSSAGNQDEKLPMLVVKYEFENTSDQKVIDYAHTWDEHVLFSQFQADSLMKLEPSDYQLDTDNQMFIKSEEIDPNDKIIATAYYQLKDSESPLTLSVLQDETIIDFDLKIEDLLKLPKQSALFFDDNNQGYLFDFNTLYLLNPSQELADQLNLEINSLEDLDLSEEAIIQKEKIPDPQVTALKLENISYRVTKEDKIEILNTDEEVLMSLQSQSNWERFEDADGHSFQIIH